MTKRHQTRKFPLLQKAVLTASVNFFQIYLFIFAQRELRSGKSYLILELNFYIIKEHDQIISMTLLHDKPLSIMTVAQKVVWLFCNLRFVGSIPTLSCPMSMCPWTRYLSPNCLQSSVSVDEWVKSVKCFESSL